MSLFNESLSMEFDYSFCIEKEISRHYLYNAADKIIELSIENDIASNELIDTLSLWFQQISNQLMCDIQKFHVINKLCHNPSKEPEESLIKKLIETLLTGYKSVYSLKKRVHHYQIHKKFPYHHLGFILSGLETSYSNFLVTLDSSLIHYFETIDENPPRVKTTISEHTNHEEQPRVKTTISEHTSHIDQPRVKTTISEHTSHIDQPRVKTTISEHTSHIDQPRVKTTISDHTSHGEQPRVKTTISKHTSHAQKPWLNI